MKKQPETNKWETGELGNSVAHAKVVPEELELEMDEALGLQLVSVRLQKSLIKDLKELAVKEGLGWPLTKHVSSKKTAV